MLFVKCKNNGFHPHHICVPESYLFKIMIDIKNFLSLFMQMWLIHLRLTAVIDTKGKLIL